MHRFHIDGTQIMEKRALLSKEEAAHALRVLRLKDGSPIEALDGHDAWKAVLRVTDDGAYAELLEKMTSTEAPVDVALFMGIPKGEKLELIAQKLTELGATRVVPVRMERWRREDRDERCGEEARAPAQNRFGSDEAVRPRRGNGH